VEALDYSGKEIDDRARSGVKAGRCDECALLDLAASRPYAPSGLLGIDLPQPGVRLLGEYCPMFSRIASLN